MYRLSVNGHIDHMRVRSNESCYNPCIKNLFFRKKPGKKFGIAPAVLAKNNGTFLMPQSQSFFQLLRGAFRIERLGTDHVKIKGLPTRFGQV